MVHHLISKGVDPNQPGIRPPLQFATYLRNLEVARILLRAGACVAYTLDPPNKIKHTWFDRILVANKEGALLQERGEHYMFPARLSALQLALRRGDEDMFDLLAKAATKSRTTTSCGLEGCNGDSILNKRIHRAEDSYRWYNQTHDSSTRCWDYTEEKKPPPDESQ